MREESWKMYMREGYERVKVVMTTYMRAMREERWMMATYMRAMRE